MPTETCTAETSHPPTMEGPMSTTPQPLRPGEHPGLDLRAALAATGARAAGQTEAPGEERACALRGA
jgi:hypothetical protein